MDKQAEFNAVTEEMLRLYQAGEYARALEYVESKSASFPEEAARMTFWCACLLSMCGRKQEALATLEQGLQAGLFWHKSQFRDTDLDPIRHLPAFEALTARSQQRWEELRPQTEPERTLLVPAGAGPYPLLIVLHGYGGNKDAHMKEWGLACQQGWMVLSVQSRWPLYPGIHFWVDAASGIADILFHLGEVQRTYRIDLQRIVVGGFSQGGGMAIQAAFSPQVPVRGFIGVGTWWESVDEITALARSANKSLRGYFIIGAKDHTLERTREIQAALRANNIRFAEEVHADLGHEFPADPGRSLETALKFNLEA